MCGSDWSSHLPLVMLLLGTAPKDDFCFFSCRGRLISLFLASSSNTCEFPPEVFLRKIERAVSAFSGPPQHHVPPSQPQPSPRELLTAEFVLVRDDASIPPLSPLNRGLYKVLERFEKNCILQIGNKSYSVSVERLKAVFSPVPVTPAVSYSLRTAWSLTSLRH